MSFANFRGTLLHQNSPALGFDCQQRGQADNRQHMEIATYRLNWPRILFSKYALLGKPKDFKVLCEVLVVVPCTKLNLIS